MADDVDHVTMRAVQEQEERMEISRRRRDAEREALLHIADDRECVECGDPIPVSRLMIVPTARLCVSCQSLAESGPR